MAVNMVQAVARTMAAQIHTATQIYMAAQIHMAVQVLFLDIAVLSISTFLNFHPIERPIGAALMRISHPIKIPLGAGLLRTSHPIKRPTVADLLIRGTVVGHLIPTAQRRVTLPLLEIIQNRDGQNPEVQRLPHIPPHPQQFQIYSFLVLVAICLHFSFLRS
ncbi:MAG: hypothetical protein CMA83_01245 [Euryarchaeota archaeon]|nr:hypothetical protein [Euryarchaeota archaeon]